MTRLSHPLEGLALVSRCLSDARPPGADLLPALPLPPLAGAGSGITASELRALAALYFQAELERAAVVAAAEAIVEQRDQLALRSAAFIARLEEFARLQVGWYTRPQRTALFARIFGLAEGRDANFDFERLFAGFCAALLDAAEGASPGSAAVIFARLRRAGADLLFNLASRRYGNAQTAGRLISAQLRLAVEILSDRELEAALGTRGMWASLRKLLDAQAPDLGRIVARAQSGLQLLNWLAANISAVTSPDSSPAAGATTADWAAQWLTASGFTRSRGMALP